MNFIITATKKPKARSLELSDKLLVKQFSMTVCTDKLKKSTVNVSFLWVCSEI